MKKTIIFSLLMLVFKLGFSQYGFANQFNLDSNNVAVAFDTSNYPEIRNNIKLQNIFIKLDSNDLNAYIRRAMLEFQMNDFVGSIRDYDKILIYKPNSTEAYSNRGLCYCMLRNYTAALSDMNKALELTPDPMSYKLRAAIKYYMKDFTGAIADLDTAITMKHDYADAYNARGEAENEIGKCQEAIQDFNKALELDPQLWLVYEGKAEAKFKLGDYDGAIFDLCEERKMMPSCENYDFYQLLAQAYEKKGDTENAKLAYEKAASYRKK
jgi:tetratricopeptide (TPR) repeat protein